MLSERLLNRSQTYSPSEHFRHSKLKHPELIDVYGIDPENCLETDDGILYEYLDHQRGLEKYVIVHVALSNPALGIAPNSLEFLQAFAKVESRYLPTYLSLLDQELVTRKYELSETQNRPAILVSTLFDSTKCEIEDFYIRPGAANLRKHYTYNQVDRLINSETTYDRDTKNFQRALTTAKALRYARTGKLINKAPRHPAYFINSEGMNIANLACAHLAATESIPILYRICAQVSEHTYRACYSPECQPHQGLSLPYYTHLSSGLRRLVDLINGYQFNAYLACPNSPEYPFTTADLYTFAEKINVWYHPEQSSTAQLFQ